MKKKYVVALKCGGVMEEPLIRYEKVQFIEAESPEEAEEIYNEVNNCSYYYAKCLGIAL